MNNGLKEQLTVRAALLLSFLSGLAMGYLQPTVLALAVTALIFIVVTAGFMCANIIDAN